MKTERPLPRDMKLTVVYRIESGCLGPNGKDHVGKFCSFARSEIESESSAFVDWEIIPRDNSLLPEMQYQIEDKKLSRQQAAKYLEMFRKNLDEFEEDTHSKVAYLIERYMGR